MADDTSKETTEQCAILQGPKGALYCVSETTLKTHRLPEEVAAAVRKAYEQHVSPVPTPTEGEFHILGHGPVVRRTGLTAPTADGWFDQYA